MTIKCAHCGEPIKLGRQLAMRDGVLKQWFHMECCKDHWESVHKMIVEEKQHLFILTCRNCVRAKDCPNAEGKTPW